MRRGIFRQAADDAVGAGRRQLSRRRVAVKGVLVVRQDDRKQVRHAGGAPAAVGQRRAAREQQHPAAANVHKLLNQILLGRREIIGFHRTNDQPLVLEQVLGFRRKAIGQFLGIVDPLAVNLVLGGAQHRNQLHAVIVVLGPPDEFVLPARLAFDVQHAALVGFHVDQTRDGVVRRVGLAGQRIERELQRLGAGSADIEQQILGLRLSVRRQRDLLCGQDFVSVAHAQRGLSARVAPLVKADARHQSRIRQRAGGDANVVDLHVAGHLFLAEAHGVNGDAAAAQRCDRVPVDPAGVVGAVAQQHDRADRQAGGFVGQLFDSVADVRDRSGSIEPIEAVHASDVAVEAIETRLKLLLQIGQYPALQRLEGLLQPSRAVLGNSHAARIIDNQGDDVLLRVELRNHERWLPQQKKHDGSHRELQQPNDGRARQFLTLGSGFGQAGTNQQRQTDRSRDQQQAENPLRPSPEQYQIPFGENSGRIFEKQFKHDQAIRGAGT